MTPTGMPAPSDRACDREELARGPHCKIELCRCGVVHLSLGPVTFRTTPEMAHAFLAVLGDAVQQLAIRSVDGESGRPAAGWLAIQPKRPKPPKPEDAS